MKFYKYQATGNDFIIIDKNKFPSENQKKFLSFLCKRHFGIGADGVILFEKSSPPFMRIFNSDGSEAEMSGNGIRCFVKYLVEHKKFRKNPLEVRTLAGIKYCKWIPDSNGKVKTVDVEIGKPFFKREEIPIKGKGNAEDIEFLIENLKIKGHGVSMGNPHFVIFADKENPHLINLGSEEIALLGEKISEYEIFPKKTNVEFVKITWRNELFVFVYERGAGITLSCGTGACAAVAVAIKRGFVENEKPVTVRMGGGKLFIKIDKNFSSVELSGDVVEIFKGEIKI